MKLADATNAARRAFAGDALSTVPVRFATDARLPDETSVAAGQVAWLARKDADDAERQRLGRIEAACSILRTCRAANGGVLYVDAQIGVMPFSHAERLEAEGSVKILRTDRMVAIHRAAWQQSAKAQGEALERSRQLNREAVQFAKRAERSSAWIPSIDWDADPVAATVELEAAAS
jgi:hypothetical protein